MIFSELCDLVLLDVNGGRFTSEAAVQRPDVESYVPKAAHAVIRNAVFGLKADARGERSAGNIVSSLIDPGFFETYEVTLDEDTSRAIWYADLPSVVQSWPGDAGIREVVGKQDHAVYYAKLNGQSDYAALGVLADTGGFYWHEPHEGDESTVTRLFFPGQSAGPCSVIVRAALEIGPTLGDSRIPLPVGLEAMVAQMAVEHFRTQRAMPADVALDNHDVNATANVQQMAQT